jgi:hypothetical protein
MAGTPVATGDGAAVTGATDGSENATEGVAGGSGAGVAGTGSAATGTGRESSCGAAGALRFTGGRGLGAGRAGVRDNAAIVAGRGRLADGVDGAGGAGGAGVAGTGVASDTLIGVEAASSPVSDPGSSTSVIESRVKRTSASACSASERP